MSVPQCVVHQKLHANVQHSCLLLLLPLKLSAAINYNINFAAALPARRSFVVLFEALVFPIFFSYFLLLQFVRAFLIFRCSCRRLFLISAKLNATAFVCRNGPLQKTANELAATADSKLTMSRRSN